MAEYSLGTAKGRLIIDYDDKGLRVAADDFEKTERKAKGASQGFEEAGNKMAVAGAVIAAGIGLAAKTAIDFEKQISAIGAVSGATKDELEILRKKALQLGADTAFSASEAALAMEELAKAGLSVTDIMSGAADATVALAAAGGIELPAAAELAADAMNSFSLTARDLPKVADLIAGAANASSISVGEFGQSLKQVGAVANLVGLSFSDTATAIALMGQSGIKGSDAGTSLKTMLSNLVPVTKQQIKLFKELGLATKDGSNNFFDAQGNIKSLADISGILQKATKDMTSEQKLLTLETLFGSDAIRAAAILTKAGAEGFNGMAEAMGKVTAEEVAAARLDNTAGALEQLKGSAETLAISLGSLLLPALTKIFKGLTEFANFLNGLSEGTKSVIINVALVTAGFLLLFGVTVKIIQFVKAIQALVAVMKAWHLITKLIRAATIAWTAVQWALNIALSANPIGLIVLAVAALIAGIILLWKNSETFRKIVTGAWEAIKASALAVGKFILGTVVPWLKKAWAKISSDFQKVWKVVKFVIDLVVGYFKFWIKIVTAVVKFFAPLFKSAFGLVVSIIKTAFTIISAIFSVFRAVTLAIFTPILRGLVAIFSWAWGIISERVELAWRIIKVVWNAIVGFLTGVWNWIVEKVSWAWNKYLDIIRGVLDFLQPYIQKAVAFIRDVIDKVWNFISSTTSTVWNGIKSFFTTVWEGIVRIFTSARDRVIAIIDGIKAIVEKVRKFFGELKAAADQGVGPLIDFVGQIPGKILSAIGNIGRLLYNKGKDLVQGLIDGILSMLGKLRDTAERLVGVVGRFLPGSPAEEGPLSGQGYVLKRGRRFVDDFAAGILGAAKLARDAMSTMMNGAVGPLPINGAGAIAAAQQTIAPVSIATPRAETLASEANRTSSVTIQNLNIQGVWDLANPEVPRVFVAKLHEQLDRYEKEHA